MKAVIMAGGEGRRLRPITEKMPKPLVPVASVPAIVRILRLLLKSGITEAAVTTGYLADRLERKLGKECEGVSLTYFREETPLGTAGGVLRAKEFLGEEDFVVISGDAVSEADIKDAAEARRRLGAEALILLSHAEDPGEYGVVLCDREGRVTGFSEKPSLSGTYSDTVNTGIYFFSPAVLSRIPENVPYDFGKDLFPAMLAAGASLFGKTDPGYWCDVGDADSYYRANMRLTGGKTALGDSCRVSGEAIASVLMDGCTVGAGSRIFSSVLCENVKIGKSCEIGPGCVIGADSVLGDRVTLMSGTRLPAGSRLPEGTVLRSGTATAEGISASSLLGGNGLLLPAPLLTPSLAVRIGGALAEACRGGKIGLLHDGGEEAARAAAALLRGIRVHGGEVLFLGKGFEAVASYAALKEGLALSLFLRLENGTASLALFDKTGLYPKRDFERRFLAAFTCEEPVSRERSKNAAESTFTETSYFPMLTKNRCELEGFPVAVTRENPASLLLTRALLEKGGRFLPGGLSFTVSDDGFSLLAEQNGFTADDWHVKALLLRYLIRDRVALPATSPALLFDLCGSRGRLYTRCPSGEEEDGARADASLHPELIHACAAAMELAGLVSASGKSLKELSSHVPKFAFDSEDFLTDASHRLGILPLLGEPDGDGVKADYSRGSVRIVPSRGGYRLYAEAASGEYARELLSLSRKEIERRIRENRP